MNQVIGIIILGFFLVGRGLAKRNRKLHIRLMYLVVAADGFLVLYLAVFREVLTTLAKGVSILLAVHILLALLCLVGYGFAIRYGRALARGEEQYRRSLRRVDRWLLPTRIAVSLTSLILPYFRSG